MVNLSRATPLKKINSYSSESMKYQYLHSEYSNFMPTSALHNGILSCLGCANHMHAVTTVLISHMHLPCYIQKTLFSCSHPQPLALTIFLPHLLQESLSLRRCGYDTDVPVKTENITVSCSLSLTTSESLC